MESNTIYLKAFLPCVFVLAFAQLLNGSAPEVSTFAPAKDLSWQLEKFIQRLEEAVSSEEEYEDSIGRIARDSNTVVVLALALGLHDTDNKYKAAAPFIVKAGQHLAAAKDYQSAKEGVAAVKKSLSEVGDPAVLKWEKMAEIGELMKQVPLINTKLKKRTKRRFKKNAKKTAGYSAAIAAIAQGTMNDTSVAKNDSQIQQWYKFSAQMRDAAGLVNRAINDDDEEATKVAMEKLNKSCDDCHVVFHEEEVQKDSTD